MSSGWRTATAAPERATPEAPGHRAWLGLGSNLGDRTGNLRAALGALARLGRIEAVSSVYETEPLGFREQPDFWTLVVRLATPLDPHALLDAVHAIEDTLGRTRPFRNAPRTIDIDLLLYDDVVLDDPALVLPHPRMTERAFVLAPLAELEPGLRHPTADQSIAELAGVPGLGRVTRLFPGERLLPRSPNRSER